MFKFVMLLSELNVPPGLALLLAGHLRLSECLVGVPIQQPVALAVEVNEDNSQGIHIRLHTAAQSQKSPLFSLSLDFVVCKQSKQYALSSIFLGFSSRNWRS